MEAYPEWYIRLVKQEKVGQTIRMFVNRLKGAVYQKKLASLNNVKKLKKKSQTLKDFKLHITRKASILKTGLIELKQFSKSQASSPSKFRISPPHERGIGSHSVISSTTNQIEKPLIKITKVGDLTTTEKKEVPQGSTENVDILDFPKDDEILKDISNRPSSNSPPKSQFYQAQAESGQTREAPKRTLSWNVRPSDVNAESKQNFSAFVINKNNTSVVSSDAVPMSLAPNIFLQKKQDENQQRLKYFIHPESNIKYLYEFIHTLIILYSSFGVPVYVINFFGKQSLIL